MISSLLERTTFGERCQERSPIITRLGTKKGRTTRSGSPSNRGFLFVCLPSCISIPLHGARRAMAATCRCPSRQTTFSSGIPISDPRPALIGGIVGVSQHLLLPRSARKALPRQKKKQRKGRNFVQQSGLLHPYSSVPSGVDSTSISTSISASSPPPAGRPGSHPRVPREPGPLSPGVGGGGISTPT